MEIKHKYDVGDRVLVNADRVIQTVCPFCEGQTYRMLNGEKCYCQNCEDGQIKFRSDEIIEVVGVVEGIHIDVRKAGNRDEDDGDGSYDYLDEGGNQVEVEYYISDTPDNAYSYGTYSERAVHGKAEK